MKYHFQLVSKTAVRIELIAEHKAEQIELDEFAQSNEQDEKLLALFRKGITAYHNGATLTQTKFMSFPKVALCTYQLSHQTVTLHHQPQTEALL